MSEVIEIYGAQIGPPLSYLIALTPIIVVFVVAFAVAWGWRVHVENGQGGNYYPDLGDYADRGIDDDLPMKETEWIGDYQKR